MITTENFLHKLFLQNRFVRSFSLLCCIALLTLSCRQTALDCGPFPNRFDVTGFITNEKQVFFRTDSTRSLQLSSISSDTLSFDEVALEITAIQDTYIAAKKPVYRFRLVPAAYACSPAIPVTDDQINSITISSESDFNESYPAGENLADLFDVYANYLQKGPRLTTDTDFDIIGSNVPESLVLLLNTPPEFSNEFEFNVRIDVDGKQLDEFKYTTIPLFIGND